MVDYCEYCAQKGKLDKLFGVSLCKKCYSAIWNFRREPEKSTAYFNTIDHRYATKKAVELVESKLGQNKSNSTAVQQEPTIPTTVKEMTDLQAKEEAEKIEVVEENSAQESIPTQEVQASVFETAEVEEPARVDRKPNYPTFNNIPGGVFDSERNIQNTMNQDTVASHQVSDSRISDIEKLEETLNKIKIDERERLQQEARVQELEEKRAQARERINELEEKRNAANVRISELEEKGSAAKERINELEEKRSAANERINELEEKRFADREKLQNLETVRQQQDEKITELKEGRAAAIERINELEEALRNQKAQEAQRRAQEEAERIKQAEEAQKAQEEETAQLNDVYEYDVVIVDDSEAMAKAIAEHAQAGWKLANTVTADKITLTFERCVKRYNS